jgi:putative transposase
MALQLSLKGLLAKLSQYFDFYNQRRPHSRLDRQTPDQVYFESLPLKQAA